jgi:DNA-binding transcriptional LysR family regulator
MTNIHRWIDMRGVGVFVQAARDGNFTLTAERLNMSQSAVSKSISRLEAELGATLFRRSPRAVVLTTEGALFLEEAERLRAAAERARDVLKERDTLPQRKLRIAVPIHFGRSEIGPRLPLFMERFPTITIEALLVNNGQIDLIDREIDVALQIGNVIAPHRLLVDETIAHLDTVLCASPAYVERHGSPDVIAELAKHRTLGGIDEVGGRVMPWRFRKSGKAVSHKPEFNLITNSIEVLLNMALSGCGIAHLPYYLAADSIRQGRLQIIMPRQELELIPVQVICARARAADPEVKALVALLKEVIGLQPMGYLRRLARPAAGSLRF